MGQIQYSEKYSDEIYEYRHVVLPPEVAKLLPKNRLLSELYSIVFILSDGKPYFVTTRANTRASDAFQNEWRAIGVQQSRGWVHYAIHRPEPHIMLFRRPLNYQPPQESQAQHIMAK